MSENESGKSSLDLLKEEAVELGVSFSPNIGETTLQERIDEHKADNYSKDNETTKDEVKTASPKKSKVKTPPVQKSDHQKKMEKYKTIRNKANRLIRVNITCMNPNKRHMNGDIYTVGNKVIGTIKKMVPFNTTEGFHVPQAILTILEDKTCTIFVDHILPGKGNKKTKKGKQIKEFAIQYLDDLDDKELKELAKRQALSGAIDTEV